MIRFSSAQACILLAAVGFLVVPDRAMAEARHYFARGNAQFVSANDFVGSGFATHLGAYDEIGAVNFTPTSDPAVLLIDGWACYTAADGSVLHAIVTGQLNGATGAIIATVDYVGGDGRFVGATGSSSLTGQLLPGGAVSVEVKGTIDY